MYRVTAHTVAAAVDMAAAADMQAGMGAVAGTEVEVEVMTPCLISVVDCAMSTGLTNDWRNLRRTSTLNTQKLHRVLIGR